MDVRTAAILLVVGAVLLIIGLFVEATIYTSIAGTATVTDETVSNISTGAVTQLTHTDVVSGTVNLTNSTGTEIPSANYTLTLSTGVLTMGTNDDAWGTSGLIDYDYEKVSDDTARASIQNVQGNVASAFELAGVGLIVLAAAFILTSLMGFGG